MNDDEARLNRLIAGAQAIGLLQGMLSTGAFLHLPPGLALNAQTIIDEYNANLSADQQSIALDSRMTEARAA